MPPAFAEIDRLLIKRTVEMTLQSRELNGSLAAPFRRDFAEQLLPALCSRLERARALAAAGQLREAGTAYQSLLLGSQVLQLSVAVWRVAEYADTAGQPSWEIADILSVFAFQMAPLLNAALSEDPAQIAVAVSASGTSYGDWGEYIQRWSTSIQSGAESVATAKYVWDTLMLVIATYEAATAAAALATRGPPMPPLPAVARAGGVGSVIAVDRIAYAQLVEALKKLVASGAMDGAVVVGMSKMFGGATASQPPPDPRLPISFEMRRPPRPGDAKYKGVIQAGGWRLTPPGMGAHLVDRAVTKGSPSLAKFNRPNTPRFYPQGSAENAGEAHRRLHEAGRKVSGIKLEPRGGFADEKQLLDAYRKAYSDPSVEPIRGELRTPDGKLVLGKNLTPREAFEKLLAWAEGSW